MNNTIGQYQMLLHQQQHENQVLKDILMARGIPFENDLENRKTATSMQQRRPSGSVGPSPVAPRPAAFQNVIPAASPASGYHTIRGDPCMNGKSGSMTGSASGRTNHTHSTAPTSPLILEQAIKQEYNPISDMPGIFEKDPQLGIEFILS